MKDPISGGIRMFYAIIIGFPALLTIYVLWLASRRD
jgi:hypothetical protein